MKLGRPPRTDKTQRLNLRLNQKVKNLIAHQASLNTRSESGQIERLAIEIEALRRVLEKNPDFIASFVPKFNAEIQLILQEI